MWPFTSWGKKNAMIGRAQTIMTSLGDARGMERTADAYADEGYGANTVVFRCVDIISKAVASIPITIRKADNKGEYGDPQPNHELARLLAKPNPLQSYRTFTRANTALLLITGTNFTEAITTGLTPMPGNPFVKKQRPIELWSWSPFHMKVAEYKPKQRMPIGYAWDNGDATQRRAWDVDKQNGDCNLFIWKTFNAKDDRFGMSALQAAALATDRSNAAGKWNFSLLKNRCAPPGALSTEQVLSADQYNALKEQVEKQYSGADNAGRPFLLEAGLKWITMALNPAEMDWLEGSNMASREIAAAFGVPTQVIPLQGDQTFANYEQARAALWEDTVIPLAMDYYDELNRFFAKYWPDEKLAIVPDLNAIPALEVRRAERMTSLSTCTFLSTNEKRAEINYAAHDPEEVENEADMIFAPAGIPLGGMPAITETEPEPGSEADANKIKPGTAPVDGAVANTGLNGAQVTAFAEVIQQVVDGQLPAEAAIIILVQSFPLMDPAQIQAAVNAAAKFEPTKPDPEPTNVPPAPTPKPPKE